MFYTDVPTHEWYLFGSVADGTDDHKSDLDVMLCGVTHEQLKHPYFVETLKSLKTFSTEEGHSLDLFLDIPDKNRLQSIYSPRERAIDAGPEVYRHIKAHSKPCFITQLFHLAIEAARQGRSAITSYQEFEARQIKKMAQYTENSTP